MRIRDRLFRSLAGVGVFSIVCWMAPLSSQAVMVWNCPDVPTMPTLSLQHLHRHDKKLSEWQQLGVYFREKCGERLLVCGLKDGDVPLLLDDQTKYVICNNLPLWRADYASILSRSKATKILICWEPPVVLGSQELYSRQNWDLFDIVFTWDATLCSRDKKVCKPIVRRFYYPALAPMRKNPIPFARRRLLTQICGNKKSDHPSELYSKRLDIVRYFEQHPEKDFSLYGTGWQSEHLRTYGGTVADKMATLQNFKFSICFENMKDVHGYITEKIFDSFAAGCVPIYWGASNIAKDIPSNCFIDWRKFNSIETLYAHLERMSEARHAEYLRNIKKFLGSKKAKKFTGKWFAANILKGVRSLERSRKHNLSKMQE